ncbi:MAG: DUF2807 domain-containing protein [Bacteroidales bacterium]|nr:DUF2807 domain-containing protein [Bacteroidales bacterium]
MNNIYKNRNNTSSLLNRIAAIVLLISFATYNANAQKSIKYNTDFFNKVVVPKKANITLSNADSCYFLVEADEINIDKFSFEVRKEVLTFDIKGIENMSMEIEIFSPQFEEIIMDGASDLTSSSRIEGDAIHLELSGASSAILNVDYNILTARISGASDVKISGFVDSIYVNSSGASDFNSFEAKTIYANVKASGASDVKINPDSAVVADISGTSSLRYKNNPTHTSIGKNESVWVGINNHSVYVSEDEDTIRVSIGGGDTEIVISEDGNPNIKFKRKKKNKFKGNWAGVELGVNGYLTPSQSIDMPTGYEFMELKYEKSTNFNINFFQQSFGIIGNKFGFVTGLGLRWNNYRFDNNIILDADSSVFYGYQDPRTERAYEKSKLTAWYLTMPILFEFQTNRHHNTNSFHLTAGVIGGIRMGSHSKQVYRVNGSGKHKPKVYDDFHLQPFILDATVRIGWGPLNIYGTYSITEMFRNDSGPELYPFSIGLILPFT